jgi:hypothetical protein
MHFAKTSLQDVLTVWRRATDVRRRATGDNVHFEERVSTLRQEFFETEAAGAIDPQSLEDRQADYFETFVKVDAGLWPHTFLPELLPTDLGPGLLEPFQQVVRLEDLTRPLEAWAPGGANVAENYEILQRAFSDPSQSALFASFLASWNRRRDRRPAFAAWKDQLLDELDKPDWPDLLRDRLGLAHYDCRTGPVPVALVEYLVDDVIREADINGLSHAFTAPTVLDSGPWPYFFPAPRDLPYGRAVSLGAVDDESRLLAEMLHIRLTYRREHIVRLGQIRRSTGKLDLKELRNGHLLALQVAAGREFGEEIL